MKEFLGESGMIKIMLMFGHLTKDQTIASLIPTILESYH